METTTANKEPVPLAEAEVTSKDKVASDTELGEPLGDVIVEEPKKTVYKDLDDWEKDEDGEVDNADLYPLREVKFQFIGDTPVSFNPVVSLIGIVCLWGVAIWCMGALNTTAAAAAAGNIGLLPFLTSPAFIHTQPFAFVSSQQSTRKDPTPS